MAINRYFKNKPAAFKKAYTTYNGQNYRCNNPNASDYKFYGAKGIKIEYTRAEFIRWYTKEIKKFSKIKNPTVGRIDHSKNYSLDNIEIQSWHDNVKEMVARNGSPNKRTGLGKRVGLFRRDTDQCIGTINGLRLASKVLGMNTWNIHKSCLLGKKRVSKKYLWYYLYCDPYGNILT